ncbi:MAG: DUF4397 domain-containing protein [Bacteroidetes bacterium]|nr:DUF4397 domain-containing protein [Fibrella sp.]
MKLSIKHIQVAVGSALVVATGIIGCQDPDYPAAQPSTTGYNTTSTRVLFVNATPNAASLRLSVDNSLVGTLTPSTSTTYVGVPLGAVAATAPQIRVSGAGGTLGANDFTSKGALLANTAYTIFITDSITRPAVRNAAGTVTDIGGIRTLQVTDNLTAPAAGNAHVRVFHLSPDAPTPVSVRLQPTAPTSTTVAPAFLNRVYRAATVTTGTGTTAVTTNYANFTPVPAGTYTAQVYAGATIPPTSSTVSPILTVPSVTVADGKIYTIYARGLRRTGTLGAGVVQHN